jgi:hypothetical protein
MRETPLPTIASGLKEIEGKAFYETKPRRPLNLTALQSGAAEQSHANAPGR